MSHEKPLPGMKRVRLYLWEENRRRLAELSQSEKADLVNKVLDFALAQHEKKRDLEKGT